MMTPNGVINDFIEMSDDGLLLANFPQERDTRHLISMDKMTGRNLLSHG